MEITADTPGFRDTIFCSPTTISTMKWDPSRYMEQRVTMVKTIMAMFRKRHEERGQKCVHALPLLSRRLELCLCLTASTFEEYFNMFSLKRRMHSLVLLLMSDSTVKPHEFLPPGFGTSRMSLQKKRDAANLTMEEDLVSTRKRRRLNSAMITKSRKKTSSTFILNNHEDLICHVYSFLNGFEAIKHQAVNHFARGYLRNCVTSLVMPIATFTTLASDRDMFGFLSSFPLLRDIRIGTVESLTKDKEFPQVRRYPSNDVQRHPKQNEKLVEIFAAAIHNNAVPKLERLCISSVFCSSPSNSATIALMKAIQNGGCPELKYFGYSGNSIRDDGALFIAHYLKSGKCKKLRFLDLRQNFIGVRGLESICSALREGTCPEIEALCFGGNILVDDAVGHLLEVVSSENCTRIRFLGLEHNFITSKGIAQLAARRSRAQIVDLSKIEE